MINEARLQELVDDFGTEDLAELIESFLEEAEEVVAGLESSVSDDYSQDRSGQFHFLKGCALNVGATDLAKVCEELEYRQSGFSHAEYQSLKAQFGAVQSYFLDGGLKKIA